MAAVLDHFVWGAPDLDQGVEEIATLIGIRPAYGGEHPGLGTRNALLSAGEGLYFEVIAPDPAQSLEGNFGGVLAGLTRGQLFTFAVQTSDLAGLAGKVEAAGIPSTGVMSKQRTAPDGKRIAWDMLIMHGDWRAALPFCVDWKGSQHPSEVTPKGVTVRTFRVVHPHAYELGKLYAALDMEVAVALGTHSELLLQLETPNGEAWLTGSADRPFLP